MNYLRNFDSVQGMNTALQNISHLVVGAAFENTTTHVKLKRTSKPTNITISCTNNTVTITATNATAIQYKINDSSTWTAYTQPFEISETVMVYVKATNSYGDTMGSQQCSFGGAPTNLTITCTTNIVTISATDATTIQYRTNPSGEWVTYSTPFAITETVTVYAKASNAYGEITGSQECVYVAPPSNLVISCTNNMVTITADNATTLEYNTDGSSTYTTYTSPFAITETVTVYAKASNSVGEITGSQECVYVAPPSNLNITCTNNTVTISATDATTIQYRTNPSGEWTTYSAPFEITETVTVYAKASNAGGEITGSQECVYVPLPSNLTISCTANTVTISATNATTIQYRTNPSGEWVTYSAPFAITETVTVYAKATNAGGEITGSQLFTLPSNLTISCSANTVTISATDATTIEYRTDPNDSWTTYSAPFAITETVTVYAKASNTYGEITGSQECVYSGEDPYITYLKSIGCVFYCDFSGENGLRDLINDVEFVASGNGSYTYDSQEDCYTITTPSSSSLYVGKWSNGINKTTFPNNNFTAIGVLKRVSTSGNLRKVSPCATSDTTVNATNVMYNGTNNLASWPSAKTDAAYVFNTSGNARILYQNGALFGSYGLYSPHSPANWSLNGNGLILGLGNSGSMSAKFYGYWLFNTVLGLQDIRKVLGYEPYNE